MAEYYTFTVTVSAQNSTPGDVEGAVIECLEETLGDYLEQGGVESVKVVAT